MVRRHDPNQVQTKPFGALLVDELGGVIKGFPSADIIQGQAGENDAIQSFFERCRACQLLVDEAQMVTGRDIFWVRDKNRIEEGFGGGEIAGLVGGQAVLQRRRLGGDEGGREDNKEEDGDFHGGGFWHRSGIRATAQATVSRRSSREKSAGKGLPRPTYCERAGAGLLRVG